MASRTLRERAADLGMKAMGKLFEDPRRAEAIAKAVARAQGRIADLSEGGINPGSYRLLFEVGAYFGSTPHLFETIALEVQLEQGRHYHVPLLIAPYSCSSYRGV